MQQELKQEKTKDQYNLNKEEIKSLFADFIQTYYMKARIQSRLTSYRFKHVFENMTDNKHYISNEDAIDVFISLGYKTKFVHMNKPFNIKLKPQYRYNDTNYNLIDDKIKKKREILNKYTPLGCY